MIERYGDHAANERTFLAWLRTAIAIMAFGFLVEKFDLFLRITGEARAARSLPTGSEAVGNLAGFLLIVLGGAMMFFAAIRFRKTGLDIEAKERYGRALGHGWILHSCRCSCYWGPPCSWVLIHI
jgi:putative membrane protein